MSGPPKAARQSEIKNVTYQYFGGDELGMHYLDTESIKQHLSEKDFAVPQRIEFHLVLLFVSGTGSHSIDMIQYPVSAGTLLFVRPGQVQEWDTTDCPDAKMLAFHPSFLLPERPEHQDSTLPPLIGRWPAQLSLSVSESSLVETSIDEIRREIAEGVGSPAARSLLLHMLCVLLIRVTRIAEVVSAFENRADPGDIYHSFRRQLEHNYNSCRSVAGYAAMLGYSEKSLQRAVIRSTGITPKKLIDERTALEAQRLLVYTSWPLKRIAAGLGFAETTNFVKFFRRTTGTTPQQFRAERSGIRNSLDQSAEAEDL